MNRKAQVESGVFQNLVIGVIIVSAVALMSVGFLTQLGNNYGAIDTSDYQSLSRYNEINSTIGDFNDKIQGNDDQQPESTNIIDLIVTAGYGTIKLMFQVPGIITGMMYDAGSVMVLPTEFMWMVSSIILVLVIFAAFAVIMKVRA